MSRGLIAKHLGTMALAVSLVTGSLPSRAGSHSDGFTIDLYQGSIIGSSRIIAMGGAYGGVGEGIEGYFLNPAALAHRARHAQDWFDADLSLDWLIQTGGELDLDNDGLSFDSGSSLGSLSFGLSFLFGDLAFGMSGRSNQVSFRGVEGGGELVVSNIEAQMGFAVSLLSGELIVGAGVGAYGFNGQLRRTGQVNPSLWEYRGMAWSGGVLWRPPDEPFRVGAQFRFPTQGEPQHGAHKEGELAALEGIPAQLMDLPDSVWVPWQLGIGGSYYLPLGTGRYNYRLPGARGWCFADETYDRRYVLLAADLVLVGPSPASLNFEGYVNGSPKLIGRGIGWSLRLGAETELVDDRLRLRVGTYTEPDRTQEDVWLQLGRVHGTAGVEARVFNLWGEDIKLGFAFDIAQRYENLLFSVGFWR